jgi:hypothetical protein
MEIDPKRALAAARAVAAQHGLAADAPTVLSAGSNVLVHLRPWRVVARVMTGTVVLHDDPARWLRREVEVTRFLAPTGLAVAPTPVIDPGPFCHDGLWMTFCALVDHGRTAELGDGPEALGAVLRTLHEALASYDGELGDISEVRADIARLLMLLRPSPALPARRIAELRSRLEALDATVFSGDRAVPVQALHGDASLTNLLWRPRGFVFNDFEDVFRGPLHWDVASFAEALRLRGADTVFIGRALAAYGWTEPDALAPFTAAQTVYGEIWQAYDAQRRS